MDIEQHTQLKIEKDNKLIVLDVPPDMSLGLIFDALMELKGYIVERMVTVQREEEKEAEGCMGDDKPKEEPKEEPKECNDGSDC